MWKGKGGKGKTYSLPIPLDDTRVESVIYRLAWCVEGAESYAVASGSAEELEAYAVHEVSGLS